MTADAKIPTSIDLAQVPSQAVAVVVGRVGVIQSCPQGKLTRLE